ncbi:hypothetical protein [Massilia sp. Se16.2.3]|uniref:hypothetical protein n=1 Tax=Massilia sp. Se16.2.3 TaxID=2709303 RepID=UPI001603B470|nr:hypothetical protein [Massilia sp. Se16.2.3]QNA99097.1 hypothetical protein G4G31_09950 [Massilia sp. Se16.2.3]
MRKRCCAGAPIEKSSAASTEPPAWLARAASVALSWRARASRSRAPLFMPAILALRAALTDSSWLATRSR